VSDDDKGPYGPSCPAPPHEALREMEKEMKESGRRMGWGTLLGVHVSGDTLVYRFKSVSVTRQLPPGSRTA
jgi:hypothetical protein